MSDKHWTREIPRPPAASWGLTIHGPPTFTASFPLFVLSASFFSLFMHLLQKSVSVIHGVVRGDGVVCCTYMKAFQSSGSTNVWGKKSRFVAPFFAILRKLLANLFFLVRLSDSGKRLCLWNSFKPLQAWVNMESNGILKRWVRRR